LGSSHAPPQAAAASAEGSDGKLGCAGDQTSAASRSSAVSNVPNPSGSSGGGIESVGIMGEGGGKNRGSTARGLIGGCSTLATGEELAEEVLSSSSSSDVCVGDIGFESSSTSLFSEILSNVDGSGSHPVDIAISFPHMELCVAADPPQWVEGSDGHDGVDISSSLSPCMTETDGADQDDEGSGKTDFVEAEGSPQALAQGSSIVSKQI